MNKQARSDFAAVRDSNGLPMIFAADQDGLLCLIARKEDGHNEILDMNSKFGLPTPKFQVTALAADQASDGTIHLVFAIREDGKADQLYALRPMSNSLADWKAWIAKSDLYSGPQDDVYVREILLVCV